MALTKTAGQAMQYEQTGIKSASRNTSKKTAIKVAEQLNTSSLIWLLVKRHKVGILAVGNVILVLNYIFPEWMELVKSVI